MPLIPIEKWREKSAWEDYWSNFANYDDKSLFVEESYLPTTPLLGYGFAREAFLAGLKEKHRILFLGNGISREPLDYYFSGFDVTVIDISEKACEIFSKITVDVTKNVRFFLYNTFPQSIQNQDEDKEEKITNNRFVYRAGGSIEIISADMFNWQPENKWHYIHNKLAFLAFTEEEQILLLSRYYSWLENGGNLQISYYYHNNHPFSQIAAAAKKIGFIVKDEDEQEINNLFKMRKEKFYQDNPSEYKKAWIEYEFRQREQEMLVDRGAKMLRIIFSSVL